MARSLDPVLRDQVIARLRQNEKVRDITSALGVSGPSIYKIAASEGIGNIDHRFGRRPAAVNTLTVPPGSDMDRETVTLSMSHEEFAQLAASPKNGAMLVAAQMKSDSLRSRILVAVGDSGPFLDIAELANFIRRKADNFGYHELTTIVKHLNKQGLISLKESKRVTPGATDSRATHIELTDRGRKQLGLTVPPITERVLEYLCREGGATSSVALLADLWQGPQDDATDLRIKNALEILNQRGQISYKLGERGVFVDVKPTSKGYGAAGWPVPGHQKEGIRGQAVAGSSRPGHAIGTDGTQWRSHGATAEGGPITRSVASPVPTPAVVPAPPQKHVEPIPAPEVPIAPTVTPYPLLVGLRASFSERAAMDAKASRYAEAAGLLEHDDPEESRRLMDKALALSPRALTDLEKEYLLFAEAHDA